MSTADKQLADAVAAADGALAALKATLARLKEHAPLREQDLDITGPLSADGDAFAMRFSRLQDIIGNQLFRALITIDGQRHPVSMREMLDDMEARELIDVETWYILRGLRNGMTHEYYHDDRRRVADILNDAILASDEMIAVYERVRSYATAILSRTART